MRFLDGGGVFAQNGQNCPKKLDFCKICTFFGFSEGGGGGGEADPIFLEEKYFSVLVQNLLPFVNISLIA